MSRRLTFDANLLRRFGGLAPVLGTVGGLWAVALAGRASLRRARGTSMVPTLEDGQTVVVLPARLRPPRVGDVVVARDPRGGERSWIKRVSAIGPGVVDLPHPVVPGSTVGQLLDEGQVLLLGDNPDESTDGRQIGPTALHDVTHVVVWPPCTTPGPHR